MYACDAKLCNLRHFLSWNQLCSDEVIQTEHILTSQSIKAADFQFNSVISLFLLDVLNVSGYFFIYHNIYHLIHYSILIQQKLIEHLNT